MFRNSAVARRVTGRSWAFVVLVSTAVLMPVGALHAQPCAPGWDLQTTIGQPGVIIDPTCTCYSCSASTAVNSFAIFDDGGGPDLYVGGLFKYAGGEPIGDGIARWDGQEWSHVFLGVSGAPLYTQVRDMLVYDDGGGPALYVVGRFRYAGVVTLVNNVAKWDGQQWSALGEGVTPIYTYGGVNCVTAFDDGTGTALYVGTEAPGAQVWKWQGGQWSQVGATFTGAPGVVSLTVFDDGNGPALYAGGGFPGGIAKWTGTQWEVVGGGTDNPVDGSVVVWDDGSGPALYISGTSFFHAGGVEAIKVAKWDGQSWSSLGPGLANGVFALAVFDDGSGEALYAAGNIWATADGVQQFSRFAKWNGQQWSPITPDNPQYMLNGSATIPETLFVGDMGDGPALYVGGPFCQVWEDGDWHDSHMIAIWRGCAPPGQTDPGDMDCDGDGDFDDIDPFVMALSDQAEYEATYPDCAWLNGDIDGDGDVDFDDIDPFVDLLGG